VQTLKLIESRLWLARPPNDSHGAWPVNVGRVDGLPGERAALSSKRPVGDVQRTLIRGHSSHRAATGGE
ncbi:MAG: hypothetical protein ACREOG_17180, partial [Gemmatimonadaceae bacterium]